jgi:hypothetical protein
MGFILIFASGMANLIFAILMPTATESLWCLCRRLPSRKLDRSLFTDFSLHVFRSAAFSVYALFCCLAPFGAFNGM